MSVFDTRFYCVSNRTLKSGACEVKQMDQAKTDVDFKDGKTGWEFIVHGKGPSGDDLNGFRVKLAADFVPTKPARLLLIGQEQFEFTIPVSGPNPITVNRVVRTGIDGTKLELAIKKQSDLDFLNPSSLHAGVTRLGREVSLIEIMRQFGFTCTLQQYTASPATYAGQKCARQKAEALSYLLNFIEMMATWEVGSTSLDPVVLKNLSHAMMMCHRVNAYSHGADSDEWLRLFNEKEQEGKSFAVAVEHANLKAKKK